MAPESLTIPDGCPVSEADAVFAFRLLLAERERTSVPIRYTGRQHTDAELLDMAASMRWEWMKNQQVRSYDRAYRSRLVDTVAVAFPWAHPETLIDTARSLGLRFVDTPAELTDGLVLVRQQRCYVAMTAIGTDSNVALRAVKVFGGQGCELMLAAGVSAEEFARFTRGPDAVPDEETLRTLAHLRGPVTPT